MHNSSPQPYAAPTVKRRLISMTYEAFLLVAVEMLATLLYLFVTGNRQEPVYQHGLKFFLFLVTATYFIHQWTDSGHTLAMKTWRIKVVQPGSARVSYRIAAVRYLLAWGWFLPALIGYWAFGLKLAEMGVTIAVGLVGWALTALLDKDRQFLHDRLAGTRLIELPKPAKQ